MEIIREIVKLQSEYNILVSKKKLTKKALCDLCVPFRDRHGLSDSVTLQIARDELSISDILEIFDAKTKCLLTENHGICTNCLHSISECVKTNEAAFTINYGELNFCPYCGSKILKEN